MVTFPFCGGFSLHYATVVEFICLRVTYHEVFWEKSSRLIWHDHSIRQPLLCTCNISDIFWQLSIASQGRLFSISKLLCPVFVIFSFFVFSLLFQLDLREKISSAIQDLFFSRKPLTYPGSACVQCGLHGRRICFCKHPPSLSKRVSVIGLYCYQVNHVHVFALCSYSEQPWMQSNCWTYMYWAVC